MGVSSSESHDLTAFYEMLSASFGVLSQNTGFYPSLDRIIETTLGPLNLGPGGGSYNEPISRLQRLEVNRNMVVAMQNLMDAMGHLGMGSSTCSGTGGVSVGMDWPGEHEETGTLDKGKGQGGTGWMMAAGGTWERVRGRVRGGVRMMVMVPQ